MPDSYLALFNNYIPDFVGKEGFNVTCFAVGIIVCIVYVCVCKNLPGSPGGFSSVSFRRPAGGGSLRGLFVAPQVPLVVVADHGPDQVVAVDLHVRVGLPVGHRGVRCRREVHQHDADVPAEIVAVDLVGRIPVVLVRAVVVVAHGAEQAAP